SPSRTTYVAATSAATTPITTRLAFVLVSVPVPIPIPIPIPIPVPPERHPPNLHVRLHARDRLLVRNEPDLGLDLERQRRQKLLQLARDVHRLEKAAQLLPHDAEQLVLRRRRLLDQIIRHVLRQLQIGRDLPNPLLRREHRAEPGVE